MGVAAFLLVLALFVIWNARGMPAGTVALPGPGFFPTALAILLAVVSLGILVRAALTRAPSEAVALGHRDIAVALAALVVLAVVFEPLGAIPSLGLFLFVLFATFARIAVWKVAIAAIIGAGLAWAVFIYVLGVQLPGGLF